MVHMPVPGPSTKARGIGHSDSAKVLLPVSECMGMVGYVDGQVVKCNLLPQVGRGALEK